jgi:NADH-quinone oxidoreductase subunit I
MGLEQFKNRNVGEQNYVMLDLGQSPETGMDQFRQIVKTTYNREHFGEVWVTFSVMNMA